MVSEHKISFSIRLSIRIMDGLDNQRDIQDMASPDSLVAALDNLVVHNSSMAADIVVAANHYCRGCGH